MEYLIPSKTASLIEANNKTIAIFIKLLATNIVANNFFGRSKSDAIISMAGDLFSKPSSKLDLVSENKATSAPEINAEHNSKTTSTIILVIKEVLIIKKEEIKTVGSGSKIKFY